MHFDFQFHLINPLSYGIYVCLCLSVWMFVFVCGYCTNTTNAQSPHMHFGGSRKAIGMYLKENIHRQIKMSHLFNEYFKWEEACAPSPRHTTHTYDRVFYVVMCHQICYFICKSSTYQFEGGLFHVTIIIKWTFMNGRKRVHKLLVPE